MGQNYLFGYNAINKDQLWDFGNDPYFHSKPFSWGICRPNNRSKIEVGSRIFFYTFKGSAGDYYLTGMMKVDRMINQVEASNDDDLYCGTEKKDCLYKIKPLLSGNCGQYGGCGERDKHNAIIMKRKCRCNIVVNPFGEYKDFCDGGVHKHIFEKYLYDRIYFVSTKEHSIATNVKIRLLDYIDNKEFWKISRFYGYELSSKLVVKFEHLLKDNA